MKYDKAAVEDLRKVEAIIESFGLPLAIARKFNGIVNAVEMQVEDREFAEDTVRALDKALILLAEKYASKAGCTELEHALSEFERRLARRR